MYHIQPHNDDTKLTAKTGSGPERNVIVAECISVSKGKAGYAAA